MRNDVTIGRYTFSPKRFNNEGHLICALHRRRGAPYKGRYKKTCKLTGTYNFEKEEFIVTYISENWLTKKHRKLLNIIFKAYDWNPTILFDIKYGKLIENKKEK